VSHTALVLGDQLSHANPALDGARRVLLIESRATLARASRHRQRRHLVLSAMRHFAAELRERGVDVAYRRVATFAEGLAGEREVVCAAPNGGPAAGASRGSACGRSRRGSSSPRRRTSPRGRTVAGGS
jgi:deoxyribodipyrimidine photolyase-related protein